MKAPNKKIESLRIAIENAINCNSMEQYTNKADFEIADYLVNCYKVYELSYQDNLRSTETLKVE